MDGEKTLQAILEHLSIKQNADDLLGAVKSALDIFTELKNANESERADILSRFEALKSTIEKRVTQLKDGETPTPAQLLSLIRPLIPPAQKGDDGHTPTTQELQDLIIPLIPPPIPGNDGSPDTSEDIRNKLELLPEGERLSAEYIDGLEPIIKKYAPKPSGGATGLIGRGRIHNIDLSAQLDGSTQTFSIPAVWGVISVAASSQPGALRPLIDYTTDLSAFTITFSDDILAGGTLETGQQLVIVVEDM